MKLSFLEKALSRSDKLTKDQLLSLLNELLLANDRLEAALQSMFDGIVVCDLDHDPVFINKSAERILRIPSGWSNGPFWKALADEEMNDFSLTAKQSRREVVSANGAKK